jgi:protein farnesyltransferase subunit beta
LAVLKSAVTPAWVRSLYDTEAGSFAMHDDGETDVRATYCALVAMRLAGVDPARDAGIDPAVALGFIARCQTHEGGFSAVPGCEAHGGYTFCAVAAAVILVDMINEAWV